MSKVEMVRSLVEQRLTAAAEEIFGLFERTIAEYEEELCRSKEQNKRQQKLLDAVFNPQLQLHRADVQQLPVSKEVVQPQQQESSCQVDQEDSEPPHIKEEQDELWSSQEGEQLPRLEEADLEFPSISVLVKTELGNERKAESSQLCEIQNRAEHQETEAAGEDGGGADAAVNSDPVSPLQPAVHDETSSEPETDDSREWEETNTGKTSPIFSKCPRNFDHKGHLQTNKKIHTQGSPLTCSICGKTFAIRSRLTTHLKVCLYGKSFTCSICNQRFTNRSHLERHMVSHTGEKPFSCSQCGKRFSLNQNLRRHLFVHTGQKPFSCLLCGTRFSRKTHLKRHWSVHSAEKPFSCSVCGNRFARNSSLTRHFIVHTREKPFS